MTFLEVGFVPSNSDFSALGADRRVEVVDTPVIAHGVLIIRSRGEGVACETADAGAGVVRRDHHPTDDLAGSDDGKRVRPQVAQTEEIADLPPPLLAGHEEHPFDAEFVHSGSEGSILVCDDCLSGYRRAGFGFEARRAPGGSAARALCLVMPATRG